MRRNKVLVFGGYDRSLLNFRAPLIQAMLTAGHDVVAVAPSQNPEVPIALAAMGARFVGVPLSRTGLNPFADFNVLRNFCCVLQAEKPDVVLSYTIKPVILGSLAARTCRIPRVYALITGLGAAFNTRGAKGWLLHVAATILYRLALRSCDGVITQNREIADLFIRKGIAKSGFVSTVRGSGVDIDHFRGGPPPVGTPVFLFIGRLLLDKGIMEFVAAARRVRETIPTAVFRIVGEPDSNPAALALETVQAWHREGIVEYVGFQADVRPTLEACHAFVLPSYHEGAPRSALEAMAMGRPVVTTDTIGCREIIFDVGQVGPDGVRWGRNGALVPVRAVAPLSAALLRLAGDPSLRSKLGEAGRQLAVEHFDVNKINIKMLKLMRLGTTCHAGGGRD